MSQRPQSLGTGADILTGYLLSKKEKRVGTPEKPLSDLGLLSYRSYWTLAVNQFLATCSPEQKLTVEDIANATSITPDDVFYTLRHQHLIKTVAPSSPKRVSVKNTGRGRGIGGKRQVDEDAEVLEIPRQYRIEWNPTTIQTAVRRWNDKGYLTLKPEQLKWSPFLTTRAHGLAIDVAAIAIPLQPASDPYAENLATPSLEQSGSTTPDLLGPTDVDRLGLFDDDQPVRGNGVPSPPLVALDRTALKGDESVLEDQASSDGRLRATRGSSATTSPLSSTYATPTVEKGDVFGHLNGSSVPLKRTRTAELAANDEARKRQKLTRSSPGRTLRSSPGRSSPRAGRSPTRSSRRIQEIVTAEGDLAPEASLSNGADLNGTESDAGPYSAATDPDLDAEGEEEDVDAEGEEEDDDGMPGVSY